MTLTEPLGDCLLVHCSLGGDACTVRAEPRTALQPGEEIELAYDPARLHLFDPATGEAIYHAAGEATDDRLERLPEGGR